MSTVAPEPEAEEEDEDVPAPRGLEYCPVSAGVEAVGDRWTLLVLRELLMGSRHFNDIHRGLPGLNRTMLSTRLRRMQVNGLLTRQEGADGRVAYLLTEAGACLEPLVWQLGDWARRWFFGEPEDDQLDTGWLLWRLRQFVREQALPPRRVVTEFVLEHGGRLDRAWLVTAPGEVSACAEHPGCDPDLWVTGDLRELHRVVAGTTSFQDAARAGHVRVTGEPALAARFPEWFAWRTPHGATPAGR